MQPGYKSRIQSPDAEYFNLSDKDTRVATARRQQDAPTYYAKCKLNLRFALISRSTLSDLCTTGAMFDMNSCLYDDPHELAQYLRVLTCLAFMSVRYSLYPTR